MAVIAESAEEALELIKATPHEMIDTDELSLADVVEHDYG